MWQAASRLADAATAALKPSFEGGLEGMLGELIGHHGERSISSGRSLLVVHLTQGADSCRCIGPNHVCSLACKIEGSIVRHGCSHGWGRR